MRRRDFIAAIGGAAALPIASPLAARAQQSNRLRQIGVLMPGIESDPVGKSFRVALELGLQRLGWIDGRNLQVEYRWAGAGVANQYRTLAAELVALRPEVILAGGTPSLEALGPATRSIPIVFVLVADPIGSGFVSSLARPGGNITGFIPVEPPLAGKWLEMLKEAAPHIGHVAFLYNPETETYAGVSLPYAKTAAARYGVELIPAPVRTDTEIEGALRAVAGELNGGLIVLPGDFATTHRERIISLAAQYQLPAMYGYRTFVEEGGLLSYGDTLNESDGFRLAAGYVDRILKGEKPADLPVQAPVRFELVVNLRAAKAIGLAIPETFLVRADKIIE